MWLLKCLDTLDAKYEVTMVFRIVARLLLSGLLKCSSVVSFLDRR